MLPRLLRWINERWPLSSFIRLGLEEEMSGGSSYAYVFGSAALILFFLQAVTGIWQLFYYSPSLDQGYNSLNYLRTEVPLGWLIHGLHYWGATAMIICVMLHVSQVFIWGAYKRPHELQWITGVFLFLLTMIMSLTGGALPWDKRSYWLIEVASNAAGTVPIIGDAIRRIMLGGGVIGQLTLSRFFILHVAVFSGILMTLAAIHLVALRKVGNAGPWDEKKREKKGPFWPDQVFKDGLTSGLIILLLVGLSVFVEPPFAGMADPLDAFYVPKPEWNFLFFYEALKYFPGRLEIIATVGIPLIGTLLLLLVPFIDRSAERRPARRPFAMAGWGGALTLFVVLTLAGATSKPEGLGVQQSQPSPSGQVTPQPQREPYPALRQQTDLTVSQKEGRDLFASQGCAVCHRIGATGGTIGPDLSDQGLKGRPRQWLREQLRNPRAHNPSSVMPSVAALGSQKIDRMIDYLLSLKEEAPGAVPAIPQTQIPANPTVSSGPQQQTVTAVTIIGSVDHGAILFGNSCASCHGHQGKGKIINPGSEKGIVPPLNPIDEDEFSPDPKGFVEKIDHYIQHGSRPKGKNPLFSMPAFGDTNSLTQQQIADLEAYILNLNGVERSMIYHPGMSPVIFFIMTVFAFSLMCLNLWGWWWFGGLGKKQNSKETEE